MKKRVRNIHVLLLVDGVEMGVSGRIESPQKTRRSRKTPVK